MAEWQTRTTQNRVGYAHVGSTPTFGTNSDTIKPMQQLDPKAIWLFFLALGGPWVIIILLVGTNLTTSLFGFSFLFAPGNLLQGIFYSGFGTFILAVLFFSIIWVWAKLTYYYYRYELREDGFRKEHGVIWKKYVTIPYEKIQNVDIYRGVVARLLGLSDLHIQTAGASTQATRSGIFSYAAEGRLPGLSREVAEQVRDELIKRSKQHATR